ncbi:hypothetical protein EV641_11820 [Rhodococcus sp. SMB37]|nr:hypothetical protein EV641_11820 [Rhodococcus sp. SMB37]
MWTLAPWWLGSGAGAPTPTFPSGYLSGDFKT